MKYQIIRISDNHVVYEAKRINDWQLIETIKNLSMYGVFQDNTMKVFRNGDEIDFNFIIEGDEKRHAKWLERKSSTHKLISVSIGVTTAPNTWHKIWVLK